jgi:hypothetical protein
MLGLVGFEIDRTLAALADFEAEHISGEAGCAFNIPCAEPDIGNTLQVDHVRPRF